MSVPISQKEYLKKYLGGNKDKKSKKKKKDKLGTVKRGIKVVDDSDDLAGIPFGYEEEDEAPTIASITYDNEKQELVEQFNANNKWKHIDLPPNRLNSASDTLNRRKHFESGMSPHRSDQANSDCPQTRGKWHESDVTSLRKEQKQNYSDTSLHKRKHDDSLHRKMHDVSDSSPHRKECHDSDSSQPRRKHISDASPPRRKRHDFDFSPPKRKHDSGTSPPKRKKYNTDGSPPRRRRHDSDNSPPRKKCNDPDTSPPRRKRHDSDNSPPKRKPHDSDASPSRRQHHDSDAYVPRRQRHDPDASPPKRQRHDSDASPRRQRHDSDASPPRRQRHDSDASPPRRQRHDSDASPPRRQCHDSDASPPRRQRHDSDNSPPRRKCQNSNNLSSRRKRHDSDNSPPRKTSSNNANDNSKVCTQRPEKNMTTAEYLKARKFGKLKKDTPEDLLRKEREAELQKQANEKHKKWNHGVLQGQKHDQKVAEFVHEAGKSFARNADDLDMNEHLKSTLRNEDPMLAYIMKKKSKEDNCIKLPVYQGSFPPNRFNIRPGYRWDGVDRSTGYEKEWFNRQNSRKANEEEVYKWSIEDM